MEATRPPTRQAQQISRDWPRTAASLQATYFQEASWATTNNQGHNAAGYLLWALCQYATRARSNHAAHQYTDAELDLAASQEIMYQWSRGRQFNRPEAALAKCLINLAIERPEKLRKARESLAPPPGKPAAGTKPASAAPSTATPSLSPMQVWGETTNYLKGCASQALTPRKCFRGLNPEHWSHSTICTSCAKLALCTRYQLTVGQIATVAS